MKAATASAPSTMTSRMPSSTATTTAPTRKQRSTIEKKMLCRDCAHRADQKVSEGMLRAGGRGGSRAEMARARAARMRTRRAPSPPSRRDGNYTVRARVRVSSREGAGRACATWESCAGRRSCQACATGKLRRQRARGSEGARRVRGSGAGRTHRGRRKSTVRWVQAGIARLAVG